jgi:3-phosphoshikimate 1-carboxyvinyltransferase
LNLLAKSNSILSGEVLCPGDKSISQRIVIIGSLINEDLSIKGFLNGEDPISTAMALNAIGSSINISGTDVEILKRDMPFISPETDIDLGKLRNRH